jgi:asparagine synthase (glutamine-hydrolysing)
MCGIAGILSFTGRSLISEAEIIRMRDSMPHRGPDGADAWISPDRRVGLGHRRLSIIDLSPQASQPMCNEDGTLRVIFNGEIYNHAEIRAELESRGGHVWKTDHSDTEVILHAFEEWGIDSVRRFRGMFAIALWDGRNRELWLIRDRIGIKPLYYAVRNGRVSFGSEIKAILQDPAQPREVNEEALYHYLSFLITPAPQTLFEGILKLPPGTYLRFGEDGTSFQSRYWDVWDHTEPLVSASEDEIGEQLLAELRTAVKLRKISDVPVGVFLSGGIDSSTNVALFSEGEGGLPVKTFSIGYDADYKSYHNELHYARRMAEFSGADYHEKILTQKDLLEFLPQMVRLQDEPIADPVCFPVYFVSKLARDNGVIVCQVGEGADELFCGYPSWKFRILLQRLNDSPAPQALKQFGLGCFRMLGNSEGYAYEGLRRGLLQQPIFWGGAEGLTEERKKNLLSPRLRRQFAGLTSWEALKPIRQRFEEKAWEKSPLNWMSYLDLNFRLPELLLMRVDKMSMGVSLEARVPFLDHKFVELAMSIPQAVKIKNGKLKYILKKSIQGLIPDELIHRKKQGFGFPVHDWFMAELGAYARRTLSEVCAETELFNPRSVTALLADRAQTRNAWLVLNFALWWKESIARSTEPTAELVGTG